MESSQKWYIIKSLTGNCEIVSSEPASEDDREIIEKWGPFNSIEDAITRRIGLIRAGKCQPV